MAIAGYVEDPDNPRVFSEAAKAWQRQRVQNRRNDITNETKLSYEAIRFPDPAGCRHAALVVCGLAKDAADAKLILEALALPTIIRDGGGDGRQLRVQKGPVRLGEVELPAIGYAEDDYGRPDIKPRARKGRPDANL